jgi:hypothetical protein
MYKIVEKCRFEGRKIRARIIETAADFHEGVEKTIKHLKQNHDFDKVIVLANRTLEGFKGDYLFNDNFYNKTIYNGGTIKTLSDGDLTKLSHDSLRFLLKIAMSGTKDVVQQEEKERLTKAIKTIIKNK